jgi:hypothetical protein
MKLPPKGVLPEGKPPLRLKLSPNWSMDKETFCPVIDPVIGVTPGHGEPEMRLPVTELPDWIKKPVRARAGGA